MIAFDSEMFNEDDLDTRIRSTNDIYNGNGNYHDSKCKVPLDIDFNKKTLENLGISVDDYVKDVTEAAIHDHLELDQRMAKLPKDCPVEYKLIEFFNSGASIEDPSFGSCGANKEEREKVINHLLDHIAK